MSWLQKQRKTYSSPVKHCGCGIIGPKKIGHNGQPAPLKNNDPDYDKDFERLGGRKGQDTLIRGSSGNYNMAKRIRMMNANLASLKLNNLNKGNVNYVIPETSEVRVSNDGIYQANAIIDKEKLKSAVPLKKKRKRKPDVRKTTKGKGRNFRTVEEGAGMTKKGVENYRKKNPGSKLKTAVTGKVKPGSKAAKRRKSFCARSKGWTSERGRAARRRWKC